MRSSCPRHDFPNCSRCGGKNRGRARATPRSPSQSSRSPRYPSIQRPTASRRIAGRSAPRSTSARCADSTFSRLIDPPWGCGSRSFGHLVVAWSQASKGTSRAISVKPTRRWWLPQVVRGILQHQPLRDTRRQSVAILIACRVNTRARARRRRSARERPCRARRHGEHGLPGSPAAARCRRRDGSRGGPERAGRRYRDSQCRGLRRGIHFGLCR